VQTDQEIEDHILNHVFGTLHQLWDSRWSIILQATMLAALTQWARMTVCCCIQLRA
jgi:hypothetical protein